MRKINLPLPPLAEQKAIAHILGTLDDKIELNRQMNRTLEDIARALFKSWFVDFDPVHAKARVSCPPAWTPPPPPSSPPSSRSRSWARFRRGGGLRHSEKIARSHSTATRLLQMMSRSDGIPEFTDINKSAWIDWTAVPYCEIETQD